MPSRHTGEQRGILLCEVVLVNLRPLNCQIGSILVREIIADCRCAVAGRDIIASLARRSPHQTNDPTLTAPNDRRP